MALDVLEDSAEQIALINPVIAVFPSSSSNNQNEIDVQCKLKRCTSSFFLCNLRMKRSNFVQDKRDIFMFFFELAEHL